MKRIYEIATKILLLAMMMVSVSTTPAAAATLPGGGAGCTQSFFTFPTWYKGLNMTGDCRVILTKLNDVWVIAFNMLNIMLQVAAYVAVAMIFGQIFKMLYARGDTAKIASAGLGIRNALIGLIIAIISVAIVNFVTDSIARAA